MDCCANRWKQRRLNRKEARSSREKADEKERRLIARNVGVTNDLRRRRVGHRIERSRIGKDTIHLYIPNSVNLGRSIPSRHFLVRNTRGGCATLRHESGIVCCASGSANMSLGRGEGDHENAVSNISNDHAPFFLFLLFSLLLLLLLRLRLRLLLSFMVPALAIRRWNKTTGPLPLLQVSDRFVQETNRFQVARKSNFESVVRSDYIEFNPLEFETLLFRLILLNSYVYICLDY